MAVKPLKQVPVTLELLQCEFCGSYHGTKEEAQRHGCLSGEPQKAYGVGSKVFVHVAVGAGMEQVGEEWVEGTITGVISPAEANSSSQNLYPEAKRLGHYHGLTIGIQAALNPHRWCYQYQLEREAPKGQEQTRFYHPAKGTKSEGDFKPRF